MKKILYETAERALAGMLSMCACLGMFLIGAFAGSLFLEEVTTDTLWAIFLGSLILTYVSVRLMVEVRYRRLEIEAEEWELQQNQEARELCEHLGVI